jgi:hypothetical protein
MLEVPVTSFVLDSLGPELNFSKGGKRRVTEQ